MSKTKTPQDELLSRTYRTGAREEPPARLDAAILAEARSALRATPRLRAPFGSHWAVPLSAAAVVVVSIGLGMFVSRETAPPVTVAEKPVATPPSSTLAQAKREAPPAVAAPVPTPTDRLRESAPTVAGAVTADSAASKPDLERRSATQAFAPEPPSQSLTPQTAKAKGSYLAEAKQAPASLAVANLPLPPMPTIELKLGERVIRAEVVSAPAERARGMMFRDRLAADAGMLLVFSPQDAGAICVWGKGVRIALAVAFLDQDGTVLNIAQLPPQGEETKCAAGRARFVLEVNPELFVEAGIAPGARVSGLPAAP